MVAFLLRWVLRLALPVLGGAAALQLFPYRAVVQHIPFRVEGSLLTRPGLSADTTLGSWRFPDVSGLPFGVHIAPVDVDVLEITRAAGGDLAGFTQRLQADFTDQLPRIAAWIVGTFLIGVLAGLAAAAAINMSVRYLRDAPRRAHELRLRAVQLGAALVVTLAVAGYGALSYNPDWVRQSRLTGTLAAAQLLPGQLSDYYTQSNKVTDVLGSVVGIQAELQRQIDADRLADTALQIMTISDMHLEANYPLVAAYAASYGVDLILNTGDEAEFGTPPELTPTYLDAMRALTDTTPMLWVSGNHDSPAVEDVMRTVPGVTVLGDSNATDDGYEVSASEVQAYGLRIAGIADPRVYGAPGEYGSDDLDVVDELQRSAVDQAMETADVGHLDGGAAASVPRYDVFLAHEPVALERLRELLPGQIRQTDAGHTHQQNASDEIQDGTELDLVEGSTGAGGLDNIARGTRRPPTEFSIESVGADCQFTRVIRFQIRSGDARPAALADPGVMAQAYGRDVTASTVYFRPQDVGPDRRCGDGPGRR
ncbi:Metallophosphoesterase [Modestobacter italicus]|uniref:Metallophosphoesterase n=1 Tax=Modestobacter italicus (strain DSM 44449 / CECT 9708 / BC 501) TaxID=2732864 RepID=I4EYM3_MODI5|nr:metallophosphoesterase [Modestobacter marinus]CCH88486.1 Metallophosphoesterase [Modestobacter marinus]